MRRRRAIGLLAAGLAGAVPVIQASMEGEQERTSCDYDAWVSEVLQRMETIKPGMTRKQLLTVFQTEGGLSTPLRRLFVSQDCPYFKVDVEFRAVGRPERDEEGRVTMVEGEEDIIRKISRPFLQFSISD